MVSGQFLTALESACLKRRSRGSPGLYRQSISLELATKHWNNFQRSLEIDLMETLANLESFVRSAEAKGFSAAARRLTLSPAAVSRNVATLERNLGVRLFQRSTRKLTLTEAGERFLYAIRDNLEELQAAIVGVGTDRGAQGEHEPQLRG